MGTTIMALVFTTILVFVVYFLIHYLGEKHTNKEAQKIWDEYDQRKTEEYENQVERYNETVKEHLYNFYNSKSSEWQKPEETSSVDLLRFKTDAEIANAQLTLSDEWFRWADMCDCWIAGDILYILEPISSVESRAVSNPEQYNSNEKIESEVIHISIPICDIVCIQANGEVIFSEKMVISGETSYIGVSVNGIGFGEIKTTPDLKLPEIRDTRYITLYYRGEGGNTVRSIYFGYDSLDTLMQLLPTEH